MIYLNIGSNLKSTYGNRFKNIIFSIKLIKKHNIKIKKISSFYETPSYPNKKNPKFINISIKIQSDLNPLELLKVLKSIEKKIGRSKDPQKRLKQLQTGNPNKLKSRRHFFKSQGTMYPIFKNSFFRISNSFFVLSLTLEFIYL